MDLRMTEDSSEAARALIAGHADAQPLSALAEARTRIAELEAQLACQARARAELVHLVCHELRTPITVISGFSRLLESEAPGPLNEEQHRFVREGLKACRRLDQFVGDLLDARSDTASPFEVAIAEADLHATIEGRLESLAPLFDDRGIRVETRLCSQVSRFAFDERRIEQVITNLMTNAIRHGRASGVIRLETHSRELAIDGASHPHVLVSVEDDGPGIPEADRERLFEPYVRGGSLESTAGLGIGLAICRRIIDAHGGRIWVEAGEFGGARFVFNLPCRACASGEE